MSGEAWATKRKTGIRELEIRLSGEQEIRWQAIRTAGYQVKEWKAVDGREGNIEYRTRNDEL